MIVCWWEVCCREGRPRLRGSCVCALARAVCVQTGQRVRRRSRACAKELRRDRETEGETERDRERLARGARGVGR
eukprot:1160774-Rhodomonas_salina.1